MRKLFGLLLVTVILATLTVNAGSRKFTLTSISFQDNGMIPNKFAKGPNGQNVSPQLQWDNVPNGTNSFVITCIDTNPVANNWVHWMIINIPSEVRKLDQGASKMNMPVGSKELLNSFMNAGYGGPQPPLKTGVHNYIFTIYALNTAKLKVSKSLLTDAQLLKLLRGKILGKATLTGKYKYQN